MNWACFNTYNEAPTKAFEAMCNQLFELWCSRVLADQVESFVVVNGSGGDGGVEAYTTLKDGNIVGVQSKWFPGTIEANQIKQIKKSVETAISIRPNIKKYIICIPRDLSSLKKGKNGTVTKVTEYTRWTKLKEELNDKYQNVELELWTESTILKELQYDEASGVYRYWFEKVEISVEDINYSYKKQEKGWLNQRYIPSIHCQGIIHKSILDFVGSKKCRENTLKKLGDIKELFKALDKSVNDYLEVVNEECVDNQLLNEISNLQCKVNNSYNIILKCVELFKLEEDVLTLFKEVDIEVNYDLILKGLRRQFVGEHIYFHAKSLHKTIESLAKLNLREVKILIKRQTGNERLLIWGNPGTGKTHGIADSVKRILEDNYHIGILVQAKSISKEDSWRDIIVKTLGLSNTWSENDLWNALESLSYRKEVEYPIILEECRVVPKVLICIDGIDESLPHDIWIKRIREIEAIVEKHKRIRFCITSRPYVFDEIDPSDKLLNNKINLPFDGDCAVESLFATYLKYYNIRINNKQWLKWTIKTPLALKLFCQCYEGQIIREVTKASITITRLLENRIQKIDNEFISCTKNIYSSKEYIVKNAILAIANYFLQEQQLERDELFEILSTNKNLKVLSKNHVYNLIDYLSNYGILYSYTVDKGDFFSTPKTYYSLGMYSFFEYILALSIIRNAKEIKDITIHDSIKSRDGVLQMLSILLLEDHEILVYDIEGLRMSLGDYKVLNLSYFALINVTPKSSCNYVKFIRGILEKGREELRDCVNKVIIPVSRVDKHPLGAILLNDYLCEFNTVGERDIVWSLPEKLVQNDYWNWLELNYEGITHNRYRLTEEDKYDGLPIIYAWSLTTVDNNKRVYCRNELTAWAIICPVDFYNLLNMLYETNDPQMKEDLMAIAMSVVLSNNLKADEIGLYAKWVINNIFSYEKIVNTYDAAIRYYGRAIIEYAFKYDEISEEDMRLSRPPYRVDDKLIRLNKDALKGTRMGGYGPIDYDLSRYVLCDPITNSFFDKYSCDYFESKYDYEGQFSVKEVSNYLKDECLSKECRVVLEELLEKLKQNDRETFDFEEWLNRDKYKDDKEELDTIDINENDNKDCAYKKEINNFLNVHAKSVGEEFIEPEQFIISAAFNYIVDIGWKRNEFRGDSELEKDADILILGTYYPATHGQRSLVMTFAEKYVWCARNIIYGYLADRIMFKENKTKCYVSDYGLLTHFPNPSQELYIKDPDKEMKENKLYLPEELSQSLKINFDGQKEIVNWIMNADVPNFDKWINIDRDFNEIVKGECIALYSYNSISDLYDNGESIMWISSAIIDEENFSLLIRDIENGREHILKSLDNPEEVKAYTKTQCYITPKEICCMDWKEDVNRYIYNTTISTGEMQSYEIIKGVEECTANYNQFGDVCYKLPSKYIRSIMNINNSECNTFLNKDNEIVAQYYRGGEKWGDCTLLLQIDKEKLYDGLKVHKKNIFWTVRLLRKASNKALEKYNGLYERRDRTWIVWYEEDRINYKIINDAKE